MDRILTYAEFSKHYDETGTTLGNSKEDVATLAASTDKLTADATADSMIGDISTMTEVQPNIASIVSMDDAPIKTEIEIVSDDAVDSEEDDSELEGSVIL